MKWSQNTWNACEPIYHRILELPFLLELMDGTLPREKFYYYLQQDAIYLSEYGKIMAGIAARLDNTRYREAFLNFAKATITVELSLHATFLKDATPNSYRAASPCCLLYTGYLSSLLHFSPIEQVLAGILPCFWIYQKVGDNIVEHQTKDDNPYQQWINTYSGEDFAGMVNIAIEICDEVAEKSLLKAEMTEAFRYASKMEWMFWDSAYRLEAWPV